MRYRAQSAGSRSAERRRAVPAVGRRQSGHGGWRREPRPRRTSSPVRHAGPHRPRPAHPLRRLDRPRPAGAPAGPGAAAVGVRRHRDPVPGAAHGAGDAGLRGHGSGRTWSSSCGPGPRPGRRPGSGAVDEAVNGAELFVHHEDVRRGRPGWEPRGADETRDGALWDAGHQDGQAVLPAQPGGRGGASPDRRAGRDQDGPGTRHDRGRAGEILLHAFGRDAARVELRGQPADVDALAGVGARGVRRVLGLSRRPGFRGTPPIRAAG